MTYSYSYRVGSVKLLGLARLLGIWRASVYKLVFRELLIFCVLYTATSCVYRLLLRTSAQRKIFEKIVVYCGTFESILPLTFILGFYVTVVVQRWWAQYCYIPWPDRIMSYFAVLIPGTDEAPVLLRRTAVRYLIQAEVLLLRTISSTVKKRFPTLWSLVDQGLMTENEYKLYNDDKVPHISSKYWVPTQWCAMLFHRAHAQKMITDFRLCVLLDELSRFKECLGTLFSYDWISIPLVYTQVATLAVYVFYFNTIMSRQYINFASVREEFGPEISAKYSVDLYVPIDTLMQLFFYLGWLKVAEQMINPFGEDDDDFECNWIVDRNLKVGLFAVDNMLTMLPELEKDRWWNKEDPQMSYTQASEKFAMASGWFGSTANLEVAQQGHGSSHGHLPNIPEDASESNFTSTHTLQSRGGDQDVSPKKKKKRLPPLRITTAVDRVDEVKNFFTSKSVKRRRSRTTATESQPGSPDISRSMPDTHFCFANNIPGVPVHNSGRCERGSGPGGRQQRCREESGEARLAQLTEASSGLLPPESASTSGVGIDQSATDSRALLGNDIDDEQYEDAAKTPLLPTLPADGSEDPRRQSGGRRRCQRRQECDSAGIDDLLDDEDDQEACRESSAGSAVVLVDGGDVSGVVPDDENGDGGRLGDIVGLSVLDSGDSADAAAAAAAGAAASSASALIVSVGDALPVKAASTTGGEHLREDSASMAPVGAAGGDTAGHLYVDDWISEHKEEFVGDSILKGTHSASACQLHNLDVGGESAGAACSVGGCRQSVGDLPAIVEMQGDSVGMEMMLEASGGCGVGGGGNGGGENLEKRVAFNPEIEKLEYDANYPVDQTLPAEATEPELPHHYSQQQQQQQQPSEGEESADLEAESATSTSYYE